MNYYFTWHDIEDIFEENRSFWPETWIDVQVYSDCVEIYQNSDEPQESDMQYLKKFLGVIIRSKRIHCSLILKKHV